MSIVKLIEKYRNCYNVSSELLKKIWIQLRKEKTINLYVEDENILSVLIPLLDFLEIKVSLIITNKHKVYNIVSKYDLNCKPIDEVNNNEEDYYWISGVWWNTDVNNSENQYLNENEIPINILTDIFIRFVFCKYNEYFELCTDKNINNYFAASLPKYKNNKMMENNNNGRCAVYTCIVGDYDEFHEPTYVSNYCDYYLISDKEPQNLKRVKWINIKDVVPNNIIGNVEISRWPKMHPHRIFESYEYSIYMDGCYCCIGDVRKLLCFGNTGVSIFQHPYRKCIYSEALVLAACKKGNPEEIKKQIMRYHDEGMPPEFGLYENSVIVRQHNKKTCIELMEDWWKEYSAESKRDQLSLPYIMWKKDFEFSDIGILGNNVAECKVLYKYNHCKEDYAQNRCWLFPYEMIKKGSRLVLYGAGDVGKDFYYQAKVSEYCNVVLWIDRKFEQYQQMDMPVNSLDKIQETVFDYVIVCNAVKSVADEMKRYLVNLGVSDEKIILLDMICKMDFFKKR